MTDPSLGVAKGPQTKTEHTRCKPYGLEGLHYYTEVSRVFFTSYTRVLLSPTKSVAWLDHDPLMKLVIIWSKVMPRDPPMTG
jgi:hypothetical protein